MGDGKPPHDENPQGREGCRALVSWEFEVVPWSSGVPYATVIGPGKALFVEARHTSLSASL
jgi:hypothetical protein